MGKGQPISLNFWLYRRGYGPPSKQFLNPDGTATSRLFKLRAKDFGHLSIDVKELTTPEKSVQDKEKFVLFEVPVYEVKTLGLNAIHDPLTFELDGVDNIAHGLINGLEEGDDIMPGLLARQSKRVLFN